MKQAVKSLFDSPDLGSKYANNLKEYLLENFSTEKNAKIIGKIISG
jgi:hypothetical protein